MISASPTGRPPRELLADSLEDRVRDHLGGSRNPSRHRRAEVGKRLLSGESRLETQPAAHPGRVHPPTVGQQRKHLLCESRTPGPPPPRPQATHVDTSPRADASPPPRTRL